MHGNIKDITGQRFNRLVALKLVRIKNKAAFWLCLCDCGAMPTVRTAQLINGKTKSCGCLHKEIIRKCAYGEAAFNKLFTSYKRQATRRGFSFNLTKEQFKKLTKESCYYCGGEPSNIWSEPGQLWGDYTYSGVDRLDSSQGYSVENCVSCCGVHNRMKLDMSPAEFINACLQVVAYRKVPVGEAPIQIFKRGDGQ